MQAKGTLPPTEFDNHTFVGDFYNWAMINYQKADLFDICTFVGDFDDWAMIVGSQYMLDLENL